MKQEKVRQALQEDWLRAIEEASAAKLVPKSQDEQETKNAVGLLVKTAVRGGATWSQLSCHSCW